jgi:hypothetical protein
MGRCPVISNFKIDQASTFQGLGYLSCEPKRAFGSQEQEKAKDGTPKWTVEVVAGFRDNFGKVSNEVLKVSVLSHRDPCDGMAMYTPIQLLGFEVGVMERTKRNPGGEERVIGVQVWFRAEAVRSLIAPAGKAA